MLNIKQAGREIGHVAPKPDYEDEEFERWERLKALGYRITAKDEHQKRAVNMTLADPELTFDAKVLILELVLESVSENARVAPSLDWNTQYEIWQRGNGTYLA